MIRESQMHLRRCHPRFADDMELRRRLGSAARARVVEQFSWQSHCQALDRAIRAARDAHPDRH